MVKNRDIISFFEDQNIKDDQREERLNRLKEDPINLDLIPPLIDIKKDLIKDVLDVLNYLSIGDDTIVDFRSNSVIDDKVNDEKKERNTNSSKVICWTLTKKIK